MAKPFLPCFSSLGQRSTFTRHLSFPDDAYIAADPEETLAVGDFKQKVPDRIGVGRAIP